MSNESMQQPIVRKLAVVSMVCYLVACALPVFRENDIRGGQALFVGWMGFFSNGDFAVALAWLSNVVYLITLICLWRNNRSSFILGIISFLLGMCFLGVHRILVSEGGTTEDVQPGIAFPVWIASFVIALFAGALIWRKSRMAG